MEIYIMDSDYEVLKKTEALINGCLAHKVKCFTNYNQLVDAVRKASPEIVIVDVDSVNGSSAVRTIQSVSPDVKIVIMSKERENASKFYELQANGFLTKPITEKKLKEQILRARHPALARIKYGREGI